MFISHNIWDVILPIDFHIFQDGSNHPPVNVIRWIKWITLWLFNIAMENPRFLQVNHLFLWAIYTMENVGFSNPAQRFSRHLFYLAQGWTSRYDVLPVQVGWRSDDGLEIVASTEGLRSQDISRVFGPELSSQCEVWLYGFIHSRNGVSSVLITGKGP